MKKLKITALALILAMLVLPVESLAAETEDNSGNVTEIPVYDMDILPGTWNPLSEMTPEKEFLLEMTSGRLYRAEEGEAVPAMAAALPVDVTAEYAGSFGIPANAARGYAFAIELNEKACWEDGVPITADDWLFSMARYQESGKSYVNLAAEEAPVDASAVVSLREAGFATAAEARGAGYSDFYVDITRFWGLEGGWKSVTDRTRFRDYAIPSGLDEFFVTPAYLYGTYLAEGRQYERWQGDMIGVCTDTAREVTSGCFKTGEYQLTLILPEPTTATSLALALGEMHPLRETVWSPEYATSASDYSACGPYRVESAGMDLIVLVRNENWYGEADPEAPELIRCKALS